MAKRSSGKRDRDERVAIPLPFEDAVRGLLQVEPDELPEPNDGREKREKREKEATPPKRGR
ncbi:MAG: hypothetical protein QOJ29_1305 [Thermoleophilaceae bacterium]|jgi:hypothetical protein|nr:hypothetical protein [Thermoleophilaceae bacterium]